jgi:hypothetical protein
MKVNFKYPRMIDGHLYTPGLHEVPDSKATHWFLAATIRDGHATVVDEAKESKLKSEAPLPQKVKSKALADDVDAAKKK